MTYVNTLRRRLLSWPVILLFGLLVISSQLTGVFVIPAYLVGSGVYGLTLENIVYLIPGQSHLLYEIGRFVTYYLVAVGVVWIID